MTGGPDEFSRVNATLAMRNYLQGVCNKSQLNQALMQIGIDITEADKFPVGCIVWWTGSAGSIPENWAIANGVDNALNPYGGTGFNLIDLFVMAPELQTSPDGVTVTSVEAIGSVELATDTTAPLTSHDHAGEVEGSRDRISFTPPFTEDSHHLIHFNGCDGEHIGEDCIPGNDDDPVWTFTLKEAGMPIDREGKHTHDCKTESVKSDAKEIQWEGENHNHAATIEDKTIAAHAKAAVVGCIAIHANHTHAQGAGMFTDNPIDTNTGGIAPAGFVPPAEGAAYVSGGVKEIAARQHQVAGGDHDLEHNNGEAHDHDDTINWSGAPHGHTDITSPFGHHHEIPSGEDWRIWDEDILDIWDTSHHTHEDYMHKHEDNPLMCGSAACVIPGHDIPNAQHKHQVTNYAARHGHEVDMSTESDHTHTTGRPDNVSLIPIERMPD